MHHSCVRYAALIVLYVASWASDLCIANGDAHREPRAVPARGVRRDRHRAVHGPERRDAQQLVRVSELSSSSGEPQQQPAHSTFTTEAPSVLPHYCSTLYGCMVYAARDGTGSLVCIARSKALCKMIFLSDLH